MTTFLGLIFWVVVGVAIVNSARQSEPTKDNPIRCTALKTLAEQSGERTKKCLLAFIICK